MTVSRICMAALAFAVLVAVVGSGCATPALGEQPTGSVSTSLVASTTTVSSTTTARTVSSTSAGTLSATTATSLPNELYTLRTIELPDPLPGMLQRVGFTILMTVNSGSTDSSKILAYDIRSGETSVVVTSEEWISSIRANDRWLLWEAEDNTQTDNKLFARASVTGETRLVSSSRSFFAEALCGDQAAWIDEPAEGRIEVVVCDLSTGTKRVVAPINLPGMYNTFVQLQAGTLVWTDVVNDAGVYRICDLATGTLQDHWLRNIQYRFPGYAIPWGDRIFSINFDRTDEWNWVRQRFGYFDLKSESFVEVPTDGDISYFRIAKGWLAIIDGHGMLSLRPAGTAADATPVFPLGDTPVDSLQADPEGTFLVSWTPPGKAGRTCMLTLIEIR